MENREDDLAEELVIALADHSTERALHLLCCLRANPNRMVKVRRVAGIHAAAALPSHATPALLACLSNGADPNLVAGGSDRVTPAIVAVLWNRPEALHLLLHWGADPHITDGQGTSAFDYAIPGSSCARVLQTYATYIICQSTHKNRLRKPNYTSYQDTKSTGTDKRSALRERQKRIDDIQNPCTVLSNAKQDQTSYKLKTPVKKPFNFRDMMPKVTSSGKRGKLKEQPLSKQVLNGGNCNTGELNNPGNGNERNSENSSNKASETEQIQKYKDLELDVQTSIRRHCVHYPMICEECVARKNTNWCNVGDNMKSENGNCEWPILERECEASNDNKLHHVQHVSDIPNCNVQQCTFNREILDKRAAYALRTPDQNFVCDHSKTVQNAIKFSRHFMKEKSPEEPSLDNSTQCCSKPCYTKSQNSCFQAQHSNCPFSKKCTPQHILDSYHVYGNLQNSCAHSFKNPFYTTCFREHHLSSSCAYHDSHSCHSHPFDPDPCKNLIAGFGRTPHSNICEHCTCQTFNTQPKCMVQRSHLNKFEMLDQCKKCTKQKSRGMNNIYLKSFNSDVEEMARRENRFNLDEVPAQSILESSCSKQDGVIAHNNKKENSSDIESWKTGEVDNFNSDFSSISCASSQVPLPNEDRGLRVGETNIKMLSSRRYSQLFQCDNLKVDGEGLHNIGKETLPHETVTDKGVVNSVQSARGYNETKNTACVDIQSLISSNINALNCEALKTCTVEDKFTNILVQDIDKVHIIRTNKMSLVSPGNITGESCIQKGETDSEITPYRIKEQCSKGEKSDFSAGNEYCCKSSKDLRDVTDISKSTHKSPGFQAKIGSKSPSLNVPGIVEETDLTGSSDYNSVQCSIESQTADRGLEISHIQVDSEQSSIDQKEHLERKARRRHTFQRALALDSGKEDLIPEVNALNRSNLNPLESVDILNSVSYNLTNASQGSKNNLSTGENILSVNSKNSHEKYPFTKIVCVSEEKNGKDLFMTPVCSIETNCEDWRKLSFSSSVEAIRKQWIQKGFFKSPVDESSEHPSEKIEFAKGKGNLHDVLDMENNTYVKEIYPILDHSDKDQSKLDRQQLESLMSDIDSDIDAFQLCSPNVEGQSCYTFIQEGAEKTGEEADDLRKSIQIIHVEESGFVVANQQTMFGYQQQDSGRKFHELCTEKEDHKAEEDIKQVNASYRSKSKDFIEQSAEGFQNKSKRGVGQQNFGYKPTLRANSPSAENVDVEPILIMGVGSGRYEDADPSGTFALSQRDIAQTDSLKPTNPPEGQKVDSSCFSDDSSFALHFVQAPNQKESLDQNGVDTRGSCDTDELKQNLLELGVECGPITATTKPVYANLSKKIVTQTRGDEAKSLTLNTSSALHVSAELKMTLGPRGAEYIRKWTTLEVEMIQAFEKGKRRGPGSKSFFVYLLLDPPSIPGNMKWDDFIRAIFYVGKGKSGRPHVHLQEAIKGVTKEGDKVRRIKTIWARGGGITCLQAFHDITPNEAFTREAAIIDALTDTSASSKHLTNAKRGEYHGAVASWCLRDKCRLGSALLDRCLRIYQAEGQREIYQDDL